MNIDSVGFERYRAVDGGQAGRSHRIEAGADEVRKKTKSQAQIEEPVVAEEPEPTEGEETQEARGVLRLLQEGHFKGVADLRLRINFAEELAGVELPEPSAPRGNGKAYAKFLEIYQGMQRTDETDDTETPDNPDAVETPDNPESVDAVA